MLQYLVKIVSCQEQIKKRQVFYSALPGIKSNDVKKSLLENICLTLGLHPWSLFIESEETGQVSVGSGVTLTIDRVTNMAKAAMSNKEKGISGIYQNNECHDRTTFNRPQTYGVPTKILRVKNPKDTGIRAVIVAEHRNIGTHIGWLKDNTPNVLIVMVSSPSYQNDNCDMLRDRQTAGYPSMGTREFLHILWTQLPRSGPKSVRFLYCSDHDPFGLNIYCILRWGARPHAASSRSMVCPGLEWVGPTREIVLSRLDEYMKNRWTLENHRKPQGEHVVALNKAKRDVEKIMAAKLSDKANSNILGMEKLGYMDKEPILAQEVAALRAGNAVRTFIISEYLILTDL